MIFFLYRIRYFVVVLKVLLDFFFLFFLMTILLFSEYVDKTKKFN